jgi:eukaryotic-like serine/threonine-protein kinase
VYEVVIPLYEESVLLARRFDRSGERLAYELRNLSLKYFEVDRYWDALRVAAEAEKIRPASQSDGFKPSQQGHRGFNLSFAKLHEQMERLNHQLIRLEEQQKEMDEISRQLEEQWQGEKLLRAGRPAEAEPLLRDAVSLWSQKDPELWGRYDLTSMLGGALLGQKKYAEAEPLLLKGYEGMKAREKTIPPESRYRLHESLDRLVALYTATGKPDEVKKYRDLRAAYREVLPPPRADK